MLHNLLSNPTVTSPPLILTIRLWLNTSDIAAYEDFERTAARIMAKHGGRIERAIRINTSDDPDAPFEVHIVSFPNGAAFDAYRNDPETMALAEERAQVIARTDIEFGTDVSSYHHDSLR
jgi:uncharacterized protein (DUF1330 family)